MISFEEFIQKVGEGARNRLGSSYSLAGSEYMGFLAESLKDYKLMKDRVIFKLVNTEKNQEKLKGIPHLPFLDLSIIFCLYMQETPDGLATVEIDNRLAAEWGATAEELYQEALKNTPSRLPAKLQAMGRVIEEQMQKSLHIPREIQDMLVFTDEVGMWMEQIYCLTNQTGISGAAAILYPDIMKQCAETWKQDFYILPASTHEVLLICCDKYDAEEGLSYIVQMVNDSTVPMEIQLSDHAYRYHYLEDRITAVYC